MRIQTICVKAIAAICIVFFSIALLFSVFTGPGTLGNQEINALATLLGAAAYALAMIVLARVLPEKGRALRIISLCVTLLMAAGLLLTCRLFSSPYGTDLKYCHIAAIELAQTGKMGLYAYMAEYAHQQPLTLLLGGLYALGMRLGLTDMTALGELMHAACILVCALCAKALMTRLHSKRMGVLTLCLFAASPVLYLYAPRFYNDLPSAAFGMLSALCVLLALRSCGMRKVFFAVLGGVAAAIAIRLRVVTGILLIAYALALLLQKGPKRMACELFPFAAGLIAMWGVTALLLEQFGVSDDALRFPLTHWLMMGMNLDTYGTYSEADHQATLQIAGVAEKTAFNVTQIFSRIGAMRVADLIALLFKKLTIVWTDGSYYLGQYMRTSEQYGSAWELLYGVRSGAVKQLCQMVYACALCGVIARAVHYFRRPKEADAGFVFLLALAGAGAFYLFWEANWRYALPFLPWMLMLTGYFFAHASERLPQSAAFYRACRGASVAGIGVLCLCACFFVSYYGNSRTAYVEEAAWQGIGMDTFALQEDAPLVQTFETDNAFDRVTLEFSGAQRDGRYMITVYALEGGEPLWTREFDSTMAAAGEVCFVMDATLPRGRYALEIACRQPQASGEALLLHGSELAYTYARGALTRSGKGLGNLCFHAQLSRYDSFYSAKHALLFFGIPILFLAAFTLMLHVLSRRAGRRGEIQG